MNLNKIKVTTVTALSIVLFLTLANLAVASVEISDFFSDFTSADVTINSTQDFEGKAVFELLYAGSAVESQEVPLKAKSGESVSRVILWLKKPQYDYYTARVSLYNNSKLLNSKTYQVSHETPALPGFHVVDFSPSNSGVKLLLRSFNPSVADIKIELLDNSDIVYTKTEEDVSLITTVEIKLTWPFLLTNNKRYTVRVKMFTHRLYAPPLINTYVEHFTAGKDVEILANDVEVDEYGASVTIRGKSQVPFDGFIFVTAKNRETRETRTFSQQLEEILISGKEDTAGIVWRGLEQGTYDIEIKAVDQENVTLDKYETVLRITEYSNVTKSVPAKSTPGFEALLFIIMLLVAWRR